MIISGTTPIRTLKVAVVTVVGLTFLGIGAANIDDGYAEQVDAARLPAYVISMHRNRLVFGAVGEEALLVMPLADWADVESVHRRPRFVRDVDPLKSVSVERRLQTTPLPLLLEALPLATTHYETPLEIRVSGDVDWGWVQRILVTACLHWRGGPVELVVAGEPVSVGSEFRLGNSPLVVELHTTNISANGDPPIAHHEFESGPEDTCVDTPCLPARLRSNFVRTLDYDGDGVVNYYEQIGPRLDQTPRTDPVAEEDFHLYRMATRFGVFAGLEARVVAESHIARYDMDDIERVVRARASQGGDTHDFAVEVPRNMPAGIALPLIDRLSQRVARTAERNARPLITTDGVTQTHLYYSLSNDELLSDVISLSRFRWMFDE